MKFEDRFSGDIDTTEGFMIDPIGVYSSLDSVFLLEVIGNKKFFYAIGPITFKKSFRPEIINDLINKLGGVYHESHDETGEIIDNNIFCAFIDESKISVFCKDVDTRSRIIEVLKPCMTNRDQMITCYFSRGGSYSSRTIEINIDLHDIIPDLYPTIDVAKLKENFNSARENILILYGEPGVGKTSFIKYLVATGGYENVAYIKDPVLFSNGELWTSLLDEDYDLVIFDDVDDLFQNRKKNKDAPFVSQLLSFSDGLIRLKTKVIITTNQELTEIDPALRRPGRCFDFLVLPPLTKDEALEVWKNVLKMDEGQFRFQDDDIVTQAALMSDYHLITQGAIERSYIKKGNKNYSIAEKLKELGIGSGEERAGF